MMRKLLYFFMLFAFMQVSLAQGEYDNEIPQNNEEEFVGFNKKGKEKKKGKAQKRKVKKRKGKSFPIRGVDQNERIGTTS